MSISSTMTSSNMFFRTTKSNKQCIVWNLFLLSVPLHLARSAIRVRVIKSLNSSLNRSLEKLHFLPLSSFQISLVGHFKVVDAEPAAVVLVEAGVAGLPPQAARLAPVVVQRPLGSPLCLSPLQAALLLPLQKKVCHLLQLLLPGLLLLPPPPSLLGPLPPEAGRDPRLRSLHCPLQVLLLHSECFRHILTPQTVSSFLSVLPPHPEGPHGVVAHFAALPAPDVEGGGGRVGVEGVRGGSCSILVVREPVLLVITQWSNVQQNKLFGQPPNGILLAAKLPNLSFQMKIKFHSIWERRCNYLNNNLTTLFLFMRTSHPITIQQYWKSTLCNLFFLPLFLRRCKENMWEVNENTLSWTNNLARQVY